MSDQSGPAGLRVRLTVLNIGTQPAGTSTGRLLGSRDSRADASDHVLGAFHVPALAPGAGASVRLDTALPDDVVYIVGVADSDGAVAEASEINNSRVVPVAAGDPYDPPGVLRVCESCAYRLISAAAAHLGDGQTILVDPLPAVMEDCAVITKSNVIIRGVLDRAGKRPAVGNKSCSGKGVLVVSDPDLRNVSVEGLEITGARASDHNGAAIRFQASGLTVRNAFIHDSENGIMTSQGGAAGAGRIRIEHSVFARNGSPLKIGGTHNVYVAGGALTTLEFEGNVSLAARHEGHELKTRAEQSRITCNVLAALDSMDSYTIDFPQAGNVVVDRNVLQQGPQSSNKAMFSYGRESSLHAGRQLLFSRNVVVDDKPGYFFAMGPGSQLRLDGDTIIGNGALVAIGPAPVADGSSRYSSRADFRARTGAQLPDWSATAQVLPDLPSGCPRLHPRRFETFTDYIREIMQASPGPAATVSVR